SLAAPARPDPASASPVTAPGSSAPRSGRRSMLRWGAGGVGLLVVLYFLMPWLVLTLTTVSTDDAYVNGHVTFVAARVPGQVSRILVDDNYRVKRGDIL